MKTLREIKSVGLRTWLWFVRVLKRCLSAYYPNVAKLMEDRARRIQGKLDAQQPPTYRTPSGRLCPYPDMSDAELDDFEQRARDVNREFEIDFKGIARGVAAYALAAALVAGLALVAKAVL